MVLREQVHERSQRGTQFESSWRVFIKAEAARERLGDQSPEPDLTDNEIFDIATPAAEWWLKLHILQLAPTCGGSKGAGCWALIRDLLSLGRGRFVCLGDLLEKILDDSVQVTEQVADCCRAAVVSEIAMASDMLFLLEDLGSEGNLGRVMTVCNGNQSLEQSRKNATRTRTKHHISGDKAVATPLLADNKGQQRSSPWCPYCALLVALRLFTI
ncbi:hypothetical protein PM082_008750 [Marasmius tenuissimus]|nr:hypothetical protein PM082_008750 [Marasmius tenuissimus]